MSATIRKPLRPGDKALVIRAADDYNIGKIVVIISEVKPVHGDQTFSIQALGGPFRFVYENYTRWHMVARSRALALRRLPDLPESEIIEAYTA